MRFVESDGSSKRAFAPDPKVFESFGVSPPELEAYDAEREKVLHQILDDAAGRGWRILFFALPGGGGNRPREEDPFGEQRGVSVLGGSPSAMWIWTLVSTGSNAV